MVAYDIRLALDIPDLTLMAVVFLSIIQMIFVIFFVVIDFNKKRSDCEERIKQFEFILLIPNQREINKLG